MRDRFAQRYAGWRASRLPFRSAPRCPGAITCTAPSSSRRPRVQQSLEKFQELTLNTTESQSPRPAQESELGLEKD